eukprot:TRINITY_DN7857_c0_g3_i4.p1 TRINITY_DN7857_c0_g3~~TRINITY_DN7857_c0_g3_i4.p1  ORF type:complete len:510 (-),score=132.56 TRINITY_DN7857_c0_g3_i4:528-2057(-)
MANSINEDKKHLDILSSSYFDSLEKNTIIGEDAGVKKENSANNVNERRSCNMIPEEACSKIKRHEREELVTIIVEIGDEREVPIVVRSGDSAEELSKEFVAKYKLSDKVMQKLAENIQANIDTVLSRRLSNNRSVKEENPSRRLSQQKNTQGNIKQQSMQKKLLNGYKNVQGSKNESRLPIEKNNPKLASSFMLNNRSNSRSRAVTPISGTVSSTNRMAKRTLTPELADSVQRLYVNAVKRQEMRRRVNEQLKQEKEVESMEWSFRPKIDALSRKLIETAKSHGMFEDRVGSSVKKARQKIAKIRDCMNLKEKLNCPFKPKINESSARIADCANKARAVLGTMEQRNKFDMLFEDAKRRKELSKKQKGREPECTFQPNIDSSQSKLKGLVKFCKPERKKSSTENVGGELSHRPKVGRPPKVSRNGAKTSIGEYLYSEGKRKVNRRVVLQTQAMLQELQQHNRSFVQKESSKMLENRKRSTFGSIFKTLDQDSDGIISAKNACKQSIGYY